MVFCFHCIHQVREQLRDPQYSDMLRYDALHAMMFCFRYINQLREQLRALERQVEDLKKSAKEIAADQTKQVGTIAS